MGYLRFSYRGDRVGFETDSGGTIELKYTYGGTDNLVAIDLTPALGHGAIEDRAETLGRGGGTSGSSCCSAARAGRATTNSPIGSTASNG